MFYNLFKSNKNINILIGWAMFVFASVVFILTTEPTASLWDCPEYISTAVKLEVGHPPGAPLFQMMGAVIANMFNPEPTQIAFMMNVFACLAGAVAIMILYWSITFFAKKAFGFDTSWNGIKKSSAWVIMGSGIVGSSAILFSDTFWFNATESEVYSLANMFTVLVFYVAIKWEQGFGNPRNNKWLLLIALLIGLGPGVHFMVLLAVPAVVMIYFFKTTEKVTTSKFIYANLAAAGILLLLFAVVFPLLISSYGKIEVLFVNSFSLPFHSGTIFLTLLIISLAIWGLYFSQKKNKYYFNTIILSFCLIIIGFSSYLMLPIRANAHTPINENNPSTAVGLLSYFNRDQYGSSALIYGPMYNATPDYSDPYIIGDEIYEPNLETKKYEVVDKQIKIRYKEGKGLFPRVYSNRDDHGSNYRSLLGLEKNQVPSLWDNVRFFFDYQLGYMNLRYFLWNFSGRQNDLQGMNEPHKGNWITGIKFIDKIIYSEPDDMPSHLANNKARNAYYLLPLILGIMGIFFQSKRDDKSLYSIFVFFIMTGIAITLYTNNPPYEPRERDYAIGVSFWAFGIWIGLGVVAIFNWLNNILKQKYELLTSLLIPAICFVLVPLNMCAENWDDHNRSTRSTAHMVGYNYLSSVGDNGIIVTYGDNDTFPLWYMQETEGYKTDVRVVNTSLLMTDWYIAQMREKYYQSEPLPIKLPEKAYKGKTNETVMYLPDTPLADKPLEIKKFIGLLGTFHPGLTQKDFLGNTDLLYPTRYLKIPVNKQNAIKYGIVEQKDADKILDTLTIKIGYENRKGVIEKKDLAFLDFLSNYNWDRPIHFALSGIGGDKENNFFWLNKYLILEGMTLKLVPYQVNNFEQANAQKSYQIIKNWEFGGVNNPKTYLTESDKRATTQVRSAISRTANSLAAESDTLKAVELVRLSLEQMPIEVFEPSSYTIDLIYSLYNVGDKDNARRTAEYFAKQLEDEFIYFANFPQSKKRGLMGDAMYNLRLYNFFLSAIEDLDQDLHKEKTKVFEQLFQIYQTNF